MLIAGDSDGSGSRTDELSAVPDAVRHQTLAPRRNHSSGSYFKGKKYLLAGNTQSQLQWNNCENDIYWFR